MRIGSLFIAAAALAAAPVVVHAQAPELDLSVGTTVIGNDANAVGTIISNDGTNVVVDTGMHQIPLPAEAFGAGANGPLVNITQGELNDIFTAQLAEARAALEAALVVGEPVTTVDAQSLGMIDTIDGTNIVIKAEDERMFTLPVDMLALDGNGAVMVLANYSDIIAALEEALDS